jgi:hypothetical protein
VTARAVVGEVGKRDGYCAACKPERKHVSIKRTAETDIPDEVAAGR